MNKFLWVTVFSLVVLPVMFFGHRWASRPAAVDVANAEYPVVESRYNWRFGMWGITLSVILVIFSCFETIPSSSRNISGVLGILCASIGGWLIIDRRVKLRIDQVGIRNSQWGDSTLLWSEVVEVEIGQLRNVPFIRVVPVPAAATRESRVIQ